MRACFPFTPWWDISHVSQALSCTFAVHFDGTIMQPSRGGEHVSGLHMSSRQCVPRIWALWSSCGQSVISIFPRSVYSCPGYLSFHEGLPPGLETRTSFHRSYFHFVVTVTQEDENTFQWWSDCCECSSTREGKGEIRWRLCPHKQENSTLQAKFFTMNKSDQEGTCPGPRGTINQGSLNREGQNQEERSWNQERFRSG